MHIRIEKWQRSVGEHSVDRGVALAISVVEPVRHYFSISVACRASPYLPVK